MLYVKGYDVNLLVYFLFDTDIDNPLYFRSPTWRYFSNEMRHHGQKNENGGWWTFVGVRLSDIEITWGYLDYGW